MIEAPKENKRKAAVRVIAEALAQATPVTAGLAGIYRFTHPSEMERALEVWRGEVTAAVNNLEARVQVIETHITPRLTIGEKALALALWLTSKSENGLCDPIDFDDLRLAFPDVSKPDLEEACFELEHLGFVETSAVLGQAVYSLTPAYTLFWAFDPVVMTTNPLDDAREIARELIADSSLGTIFRLDEKLGWQRRRLNPAIARVMPLISIKSNEIQNRYPTPAFVIGSEDRFRLRRFVQEAEVV
ncbi:MAG: hypothetical protein LCH78_03960 [Proteobacteria bacterium]|nr:hypothetical protein [Pseudomonadota bacterium]